MNASMATPAGLSQCSSIDGLLRGRRTVKRAFGWAALAPVSLAICRRPVLALPVDQVRRGLPCVMPSHQTSPSSVSATLVKITFSLEAWPWQFVVGLLAGARGHAEVAGFRVDGVAGGRPGRA